jgi:hypothetical protein
VNVIARREGNSRRIDGLSTGFTCQRGSRYGARMRGTRCGSLSLLLSVVAVAQLVCIQASRAQNAPPQGEPPVNYPPNPGNNVAPPAPPPGYEAAPPPGYQAAPPPGAPPPGMGYGPVVTLRADNPRARLQVMGPLKWQDVCIAPCNVPVNPAGLYRVGGGSIRPSSEFNMPRSAHVTIDTQVGSTVKHWVGLGLMLGGAGLGLAGGLYYASASDVSNSYGSTTNEDAVKAVGIVYLIAGVILLAVGIPLFASSTSVDVQDR